MAPYRRIVDEISGRIAAGALRPGDRIPSARQITREWGVAIATATKVLATLRQEGLVEPRPGVGTVVTGGAPTPVVPAAATPSGDCDPSYPTLCIPPGSPDLDCGDITDRRFQVLPPDPHRFDGNEDGVGCEG